MNGGIKKQANKRYCMWCRLTQQSEDSQVHHPRAIQVPRAIHGYNCTKNKQGKHLKCQQMNMYTSYFPTSFQSG